MLCARKHWFRRHFKNLPQDVPVWANYWCPTEDDDCNPTGGCGLEMLWPFANGAAFVETYTNAGDSLAKVCPCCGRPLELLSATTDDEEIDEDDLELGIKARQQEEDEEAEEWRREKALKEFFRGPPTTEG
jgi:hypothetical protein